LSSQTFLKNTDSLQNDNCNFDRISFNKALPGNRSLIAFDSATIQLPQCLVLSQFVVLKPKLVGIRPITELNQSLTWYKEDHSHFQPSQVQQSLHPHNNLVPVMHLAWRWVPCPIFPWSNKKFQRTSCSWCSWIMGESCTLMHSKLDAGQAVQIRYISILIIEA